MRGSSKNNGKTLAHRVSAKKTDAADSLGAPDAFAPWELAVLDVFVRAAAMFGFRKSVALVYGALYCAREPESAQSLQEKLQISRGSVVESLQFLRRLGAVRVGFKIGERRDFFSAETDLKKFVRGFLREILVPALEKADARLDSAKTFAATETVPSAAVPADEDFARSRVAALIAWKSRFAELLPLLENLLGEAPAAVAPVAAEISVSKK